MWSLFFETPGMTLSPIMISFLPDTSVDLHLNHEIVVQYVDNGVDLLGSQESVICRA